MAPNSMAGIQRDVETTQKIAKETSANLEEWYPRFQQKLSRDSDGDGMLITATVDGIRAVRFLSRTNRLDAALMEVLQAE